jgi:hypothetical protein
VYYWFHLINVNMAYHLPLIFFILCEFLYLNQISLEQYAIESCFYQSSLSTLWVFKLIYGYSQSDLECTCKALSSTFSCSLGSQPIGWCFPHSDISSSLSSVNHILRIFRNTLTDTPRCVPLQTTFLAFLNPVKLTNKIYHRTKCKLLFGAYPT